MIQLLIKHKWLLIRTIFFSISIFVGSTQIDKQIQLLGKNARPLNSWEYDFQTIAFCFFATFIIFTLRTLFNPKNTWKKPSILENPFSSLIQFFHLGYCNAIGVGIGSVLMIYSHSIEFIPLMLLDIFIGVGGLSALYLIQLFFKKSYT